MAEENAATQQTGSASESLFSRKNIIILVVITSVLAVGAVLGVMFFLKGDTADDTNSVKKPDKKEMKALGAIEAFDTMVVNIAGTRGLRYLKVSVSIELESPDMAAFQGEISGRKIQLTDILNSVFSSKTLETVTSPELRDSIKREIRDQFNQVLTAGQVLNVYFKDFVVQ